jgi:hypothetical protein
VGRYLWDIEADERWVCRVFAHSCDVGDIGATETQRLVDSVLDVRLDSPDARTPEVLTLLEVGGLIVTFATGSLTRLCFLSSHVIFGRSARTRWARLVRGSTLDKFLSAVPDAAVQVVPLTES